MTIVTDDGVQLSGAFWEARDGGATTVVLVHDENLDRTVWDPYVGFFLSRGWAVLAFDLRGHGESLRREARPNLLAPVSPGLPPEQGWPLDIQAALAYAAKQPGANPAKRAAIGLGLGADLVYAAAARNWGTVSTVCVSPSDERARRFAGTGPFQPRGVYLMYGSLDELGADAALAFAGPSLYPAECQAYDDTSARGFGLWEARQPEIIARSIAWIERTVP